MKLKCVGLFFLIFCIPSIPLLADDDAELSRPSPTPSAADNEPAQQAQEDAKAPAKDAVKKAENIDLKDIVSTPLAAPETATTTAENVDLSDEVAAEAPTLLDTPANTDDLPQDIEQEQEAIAAKETATEQSQAEQSQVAEPLIDDGAQEDAVEGALANEQSPTPEATHESNLIAKIAKELAPKEAQESLFLLDSEVPAGTSTRLGWSPSISFMGISAPSAVLVLNGVNKGPTLCLTAAVHGDELNGIEIVRRVLYDIDPQELAGAVIGVPIVNIQGFRRSSRYLPDRRDLNRFFPGNPSGSSAARIAHSFFSDVISHCDYLVDLHTGSFRRTNLPQIRADLGYPEVASLTEKMGSIVVVQSEGAVGSLRRAAVESGIPAITLEAGAPHELQRDAVEYGVKSVETAMDALGMIDRRRFWERAAEPIYYQSVWVRAKEGGILFSEVDLGAYVKEGTVLGVITDPITNSRSEIQAPFDGRVIGMALNQVMFPGFAAYHVGLKASVEEAAQEREEVSESTVDEGVESDAKAVQQNIPAAKNELIIDDNELAGSEQAGEDSE